ncbi:hypothetical protein BVG79_00977 [Ketogulonicigenium robustum]|uniref:Uncharacterized protein n=1 Tax=Ketogulonicigenium robustum TaxID=92947 RepID=A0A1W6NZ68_9RHOB|nr:hypothetical protein [Ketogulonicigenium robustum]ARO14327.1 hypothetical protein BVG79_00977 [Ketogulonicigenium robustum]
MRYALLPAALIALTTASHAQQPTWPVDGAARVPSKAMEFPTTLDPVGKPLDALLNEGASIISSFLGETGPIITIANDGKYTFCLIHGANPQTDQNVATSECYALN